MTPTDLDIDASFIVFVARKVYRLLCDGRRRSWLRRRDLEDQLRSAMRGMTDAEAARFTEWRRRLHARRAEERRRRRPDRA